MKKKLMGLICAALILSCGTASAASVSVSLGGFSAEDAPSGSCLIAASYEGGVLKSVQTAYAAGGTAQSFDREFSENMKSDDEIRVFLWNSETLAPVCDSISTAVSDLENRESAVTFAAGGYEFTVRLEDNETAAAFRELLPIAMNMSELNDNEKYYYLSSGLPTDSYRTGTINAGDVMLYGSSCIVVFYETFESSYSYTKIGHIDDVTNLKAALGAGSVEAEFK